MFRPLWLVATLTLVLLLVGSGGCGDDESPLRRASGGGDGGSGNPDAGSEPEGGGPRVNFGRGCERPEDCGTGLVCLTGDSDSLSNGGPPRGLCTAPCDDDVDLCTQYADDARCVQFGTRWYCVEGCAYGSSVEGAFDRKKCHGRTEFACKPTRIDTRVPCDDESPCEGDQICHEDTCQEMLPTCMPQCNGDFDCDPGRFCDPRTGECLRDLPRGRRLSERCNVDAEPDPCRGSCGLIQRPEGGRCDETCTMGAYPACGLVTDPATVGCAIPVEPAATYGDMGYCARLCDCTADCPSGLECVVSDLAYLQRPGYCKTPEVSDAVRSSCGGSGGEAGGGGSATGGGGGHGGSGGSGASVGGNAGQAGASPEGGAAGAPLGSAGALGG